MRFDLPDLTQTIIAVSSPTGFSRRSIVRLTGNNVRNFGKLLIGSAFTKYVDYPTKLAGIEYLSFADWTDINALVLLMKSPKSYTKEDVLEIHLPACQTLVEELLEFALMHEIRLATPGEFTLRAFVNGRISAYEVESISRIIESRNIHEAKASASRINAEIINELYKIEDSLIQIVSRLELSIDFEEDENDEIDFEDVKSALNRCISSLSDVLVRTKATVVSNLPVIAIAGPVNAGKSTLFNLLTKTDDAIISACEKTTRDFIIGETQFNGMKTNIIDTAGFFDQKANDIDIASKLKAKEIVTSSSVVLWCSEDDDGITKGLDLLQAEKIDPSHVILCITKSEKLEQNNLETKHNADVLKISAQTGKNIDLLSSKIAKILNFEHSSDQISISTRENSILNKTKDQLETMINSDVSYLNLEVFTEDLKTILRTIGKMTGTSLEAETLSYLFSDFCIGK